MKCPDRIGTLYKSFQSMGHEIIVKWPLLTHEIYCN